MKPKNKVVRSTTNLSAPKKTDAQTRSAPLVMTAAVDHAVATTTPEQDSPIRPGISADTLKVAGIRLNDYPERGSIVIPYHDLNGKPTGLCRWRLPRERHDGQKYHQDSGTGTRAYLPPQLHSFAPGGDLVIVEGEFKALALIEAGIKAIGLPSFNTYTRDDNGDEQMLAGIAEAIQRTKPDRILFLGDSDTATNYEFPRHAVFLATNLKPLPIFLPRIPISGPGKGIDDCRETLGGTFPEFWKRLVATAEPIDPKAGVGALAARLLEREAAGIKSSLGVERDRHTRRILEMAAKCRKDPIAKDRIILFAENKLGISRTAFKEQLGIVHDELTRAAKASNGTDITVGPASNLTSDTGGTARDEAKARDGLNLFPVPPAEPWPEAVDGAALLDEIADVLNHYLVLPRHAAEALALFIVVTYAQEYFDAAPYINLSSPEKRCGKTLTLRLLALLCDRALPTANVSEASVFRVLNEVQPCLMIDEVDTFFADNPQLRGMLNSGNIRSEAAVMRAVEVRSGGTRDFDVRRFSVFGPKVFSGIGRLAETLADRSIVIPMRRKRADESRSRFRRREVDFEPLRQKCRRWANDNADTLSDCRIDLPAELNDRAADLWEPLLVVAMIAGGEWAERAHAAAIALSGDNPEMQPASLGERLLADIHNVFGAARIDRITSADLCTRLSEMEEAPWAEACKGRAINANKLARLLKPFGVHSRKIRLSLTSTAQGYEREDFADAWKRYTPSLITGAVRNNGTTSVNIGENIVLEAEQPPALFQTEMAARPNDDGACSVVPVPNPNLVEEFI